MEHRTSPDDFRAMTPQGSSSPIEILPPELLAEIFDHNTTYDPFYPVFLSHVSTLWRRTALTTPRLWRRISVKIPSQTMDATSAKVRAWLDRSCSFPVHISLVITELPHESVLLPLLSNLRAHSGHWGRFALTATSYSVARRVFVFFTLAPNAVMLSRIDITAGPPDDLLFDDPLELADEAEDIRGDITIIFFALHDIARHAMRLTEINISSAALPYTALGETLCPNLPHLRSLRIFERESRANQMNASSVLTLLAKCPGLETFSFQGLYAFERIINPTDIVHLPHLRNLHIARTFYQRVLLSRLYTPRLEVLRLSWLNRPDMIIEDDEPQFPEEREEPVEYSQSPHTDVLTGTGLRTLIQRSSPFLRILDMDFSDARSPKDFVWLFRHLPLLEKFRIVGSDMSDKVLNALASHETDGAWLCPRLTHFELSRCDMITGRGVIALAKARNPPIVDEEVVEECPHPARLIKFDVEACASVDCESVAVKQYLMGDVDFEVEIIPTWDVFPEAVIQMPE